MKNAKRPAFHGSDLEQIEKYYHIKKEEITGFGANVNPLGLSSSVKEALAENLDVISRYPDRDYASLKAAISDYCHIPASFVAVGNGSTELICLLISQRKARHAVVIGPTYSEYQRELELTGGRITAYDLKEENRFRLDIPDLLGFLPKDTDLLILCNPNNPTSSAVSQDSLKALIDACRERDIFVMVDETYVEFAPDPGHITAVPLTRDFDNLMVIRGVSKFFAAPGLRLGYGITGNRDFLSSLAIHQNPWSVSSIAALAGELMLKDAPYIEKTRRLIGSERDRLTGILSGFRHARVYTPYTNFILVRILKEDLSSFQVFEAAIRQGLMIRDCSSFESLEGEYIRFCVMMPEDNDRLMACLKDLLA